MFLGRFSPGQSFIFVRREGCRFCAGDGLGLKFRLQSFLVPTFAISSRHGRATLTDQKKIGCLDGANTPLSGFWPASARCFRFYSTGHYHMIASSTKLLVRVGYSHRLNPLISRAISVPSGWIHTRSFIPFGPIFFCCGHLVLCLTHLNRLANVGASF